MAQPPPTACRQAQSMFLITNACRRVALMQVNGKLRGTVEVAKDIHQGEAEAVAREQEGVAKFLDGKELKKIIFVPGRILNFIVSK